MAIRFACFYIMRAGFLFGADVAYEDQLIETHGFFYELMCSREI